MMDSYIEIVGKAGLCILLTFINFFCVGGIAMLVFEGYKRFPYRLKIVRKDKR